MSGKSSKSHLVTFRLDNATWDKIQQALDYPWSTGTANTHGDYCKQVITRWAWRHQKAGCPKGVPGP